MATLTKMDMIKALVEAKKVEELRKEKDDSLKLASRLFRSLSNEKVKELYFSRIASEPEKVIEEVTEKVIKAAKPQKERATVKEEKEPVDPDYLSVADEKGHVYKKAWVLKVLDEKKFSKLTSKGERRLKGKSKFLVYSIDTNSIVAASIKNGKIVNKTICACPFITKAFIDKYLK